MRSQTRTALHLVKHMLSPPLSHTHLHPCACPHVCTCVRALHRQQYISGRSCSALVAQTAVHWWRKRQYTGDTSGSTPVAEWHATFCRHMHPWISGGDRGLVWQRGQGGGEEGELQGTPNVLTGTSGTRTSQPSRLRMESSQGRRPEDEPLAVTPLLDGQASLRVSCMH